jgi:antitoxin component YwqK of YwqJK toxin-antitoxin module
VDIDQEGYYHGNFTDFYKGIPSAMGNYVHGKKQGDFTILSTNGALLVSGSFVDDNPAGTRLYYEDAKLKHRIQITDNGIVFEEYLDQDGTALDADGNGDFFFEAQGTLIKGKIENHFMEGRWVKKYHGSPLREREYYKKGIFKRCELETVMGTSTYTESHLLVDILLYYYFLVTEHKIKPMDPAGMVNSSISFDEHWKSAKDYTVIEDKKNENSMEEIYFIVEDMPQFRGGGKEKFRQYP